MYRPKVAERLSQGQADSPDACPGFVAPETQRAQPAGNVGWGCIHVDQASVEVDFPFDSRGPISSAGGVAIKANKAQGGGAQAGPPEGAPPGGRRFGARWPRGR